MIKIAIRYWAIGRTKSEPKSVQGIIFGLYVMH